MESSKAIVTQMELVKEVNVGKDLVEGGGSAGGREIGRDHWVRVLLMYHIHV